MAQRPLTVGVLGDLEYGKGLGKKSTESDILLASFREGDVLCSMVLPLRYPEKPQTLAFTVNSSDALLLVVSALTKEIGESILAADASGVAQGLIVLRNNLQPEQLAPLLKGTSLEKWRILVDDKPTTVRVALAEFQAEQRRGPVRVPVDHHFDVKGVGPVVLGFVKQGEPRKHDTYQIYPSGKTCQVRSVQVHDEDVDKAQIGDHVGLALKGCTTLDLDRGFVLAPEGTLQGAPAEGTLRLRVNVSKFFKPGVKLEGIYHLAVGMQFVPLRVTAGEAGPGQQASVEAVLQKPLAYEKAQRGVLFGLDNPQRVAGWVTIEG